MAIPTRALCAEDTCTRLDNLLQRGVVQRTFGEVDGHEPDPQREYSEPIQKDDSIPDGQFEAFLRSGIPPKGSVLITWQTVPKTELIPESQLILLDRMFVVGDPVRRSTSSQMLGMVVSGITQCNLIPTTGILDSDVRALEEKTIRQVPAQELKDVHRYREGSLVVYDDWLGLIEDTYDEVTMRLSNNSVVVVERPKELVIQSFGERFSVGDPVRTNKGNLRRGRWLCGAYNPNVQPIGIVVDTRTTSITVSWISRRIGAPAAAPVLNMPDASPLPTGPPEELTIDILDSGNVYIHECPKITDQGAASYQVDDLKLGDRVRFKNPTLAACKYDGTKLTPDGQPQGKLRLIERSTMQSQGFDTNVFLVAETRTFVRVLWQDFTTTEELSTSLLPDLNFDLEAEVWPGEIVCTVHTRTNTVEDKPADPKNNWGFEPEKVGVVQSVRPGDRIASVKWYPEASVKFLDDDLIPGFHLGRLSEEQQDVSLYDINTSRGLSRCRGDIVLIHPGVLPASTNAEGINWLGEVVDIGLDGKLTVRMSLLSPSTDVKLGVEDVTLAYSSDMNLHDGHSDESNMTSLGTGDSMDEDLDESDTFSMGDYNELWYEYPDGVPLVVDDLTEEWLTDDEASSMDEDGDTPMIAADTSNTTPELQSATETKFPDAHASSDSHELLSTTIPISSAFDFSSRSSAPVPFEVLEGPPPWDHHFLNQPHLDSNTARMRRIMKEHKILRSSLPEGIFVRTWESNLDLLRVLIIGPVDTPYEYAPFIIDFYLGASFPQAPPEAHFFSWTTNGTGPVNPNLYEDGKICLSLLGTWHGEERHENWSPSKSTFLQILVSILGLVLVKQPYYNEAGYEVRAGTEETLLASALYSEQALFKTRGFITYALSRNIEVFGDCVRWLYLHGSDGGPKLLERAIESTIQTITESEAAGPGRKVDGLRIISAGAVIQLRRQLSAMQEQAQGRSTNSGVD